MPELRLRPPRHAGSLPGMRHDGGVSVVGGVPPARPEPVLVEAEHREEARERRAACLGVRASLTVG
jgi:hypothetical protein